VDISAAPVAPTDCTGEFLHVGGRTRHKFLHLTSEMSSYRITAITLVLFCTALAGGCSARHNHTRAVSQPAFAEKIYVPGVSDFGKVNDFLYRGAQPKDNGVEQLQKFGIDTIVDLRGERPGLIENERERAESLGIRFINLPGSGWATPTEEEIARFFSLVRERPSRKIFIHCWLGGDRSGMFVAAYRIAFDGWSPQQAILEMRAFHYLHFWHPNMARWVKKFPYRLAQSPKLASFRQIRTQP
jgi:protein tyrosine phosphatase (PTP) superfamily phosphohydrolase (DUF442 family)